MLLLLINMDPTWEILYKRTFVGLGLCNICHKVEETNAHIIMTFPFAKEFWKEVESMIGYQNIWACEDVELSFRLWFSNKDTKKIKVLPLNIAWGVWLAKNLKLFEGK